MANANVLFSTGKFLSAIEKFLLPIAISTLLKRNLEVADSNNAFLNSNNPLSNSNTAFLNSNIAFFNSNTAFLYSNIVLPNSNNPFFNGNNPFFNGNTASIRKIAYTYPRPDRDGMLVENVSQPRNRRPDRDGMWIC